MASTRRWNAGVHHSADSTRPDPANSKAGSRSKEKKRDGSSAASSQDRQTNIAPFQRFSKESLRNTFVRHTGVSSDQSRLASFASPPPSVPSAMGPDWLPPWADGIWSRKPNVYVATQIEEYLTYLKFNIIFLKTHFLKKIISNLYNI